MTKDKGTMKTIYDALITVLIFGMAFQSPAAWSAPSPNCKVLISDTREGDHLSKKEFRNLKYRIVGVKEGHEIRSVGFLHQDEIALAFDLDGSMKIYYNGMEALLDRHSDLSFEVIPVEHELDITKHDMIFIYKNLAGTKVEAAIQGLFDVSRSEPRLISGYNQVAAICSIMRADNCEQTMGLQFHLDKLIRELVEFGYTSPNHRPKVLVSKEAGSPEQFLKTLSGMDVSDAIRVMERNGEVFFATMMLAMMGMAIVFFGSIYFGLI